MRNGVGVPQNILLFGGTSDIGFAVLRGLVGPGVSRVALACRDVEKASAMAESLADVDENISVQIVRFDASDTHAMAEIVDQMAGSGNDIDVAVVAQGVLGEGVDHRLDPTVLEEIMDVNATASMALLYALSARMRKQGFGRIVLLSSVAALRPRRANPVYGASKAAVDSFALALDHELEGTGVSILVVRPGFVVSKMTAGMKKAPFATTPGRIADAVVPAVNTGRRIIHVPGLLGPLFRVLANLPEGLWRRLPLG